MHLSIIILETNVALASEAVGPESLNAADILAMCEQEPETKDRLSKDIEDSISDDLGINGPLSGSIRNTPDNWVQSPENKSETTNGSEELSGRAALAGNATTTAHGKDVDDEKVCNASHGVPAPRNTLLGSESSKETGENHDDICDDGNKDVCSREPSEEGEVEEEKRGGKRPVDVAGPEDLAVDVLDEILFCLPQDDVVEGAAFTGGHGVIGEGSEGGDEGCDDMEESFLDWDSPGQEDEGEGRENIRTKTTHSVLTPASPTFS